MANAYNRILNLKLAHSNKLNNNEIIDIVRNVCQIIIGSVG